MQRFSRGCVIAGFGLVCLVLTGCLQVPYCIPELNYVPSVAAKCKKGEVYAFRVDIEQKSEIRQGSAAIRGEVVEHQTLSHLKTSSDGSTSLQMGMSFATGWRYVGLANYTPTSTEHGIAMRFYRPGYETIVLKPGDKVRELEWKPAPSLEAQVHALDDLMQDRPAKQTPVITVRKVLEPGTASAAHKQALLFGAGEYERLAGELGPNEKMQAPLLARARQLRELADGK